MELRDAGEVEHEGTRCKRKMDLKSWELPELEKTRRQNSTQSIGKHKTENIKTNGGGWDAKNQGTWEEAQR